MAFFGQGNDLLQQFGQGLFSVPGLKDYTHASKTFLTNGYALVPKFKFLYHVFFNINTAQIPQLQAAYGSGEITTLGLLVKNIELPKFKIDTTTMNQYNRKRIVQSKIKYEPSRIVFHDDQSDMIRNMWYNYYTYYYKDPSQQYQGVSNTPGTNGLLSGFSNGFNYNTNDIYSQSRLSADWGFIGESYSDGTNSGNAPAGKPAFFRDITIYGLNQKKYAAWTLINPIISSWNSDTFDYSEGGGTMQNDVSIEFETVKYYSGAIGGAQPSNTVSGFADPAHYDTVPSGISRPGSTQSVFGQGGLLDAVTGTIEDLQQGSLQGIIGAVGTAVTATQTIRNNPNWGSTIRSELNNNLRTLSATALPGVVGQAINAGNKAIFPGATTYVPGTGVVNGFTGRPNTGGISNLGNF